MKHSFKIVALCFTMACFVAACEIPFFGSSEKNPRLVMFIGLDISGSFKASPHFENALQFLSHYIYYHFQGYGGFEVPHSLYIGTIGGNTPNEPKTFFPIQAFQDRKIDEIQSALRKLFPEDTVNTFTDFNAFFEQVALTVKEKKLILKPLSIVLLTDGRPDMPGVPADSDELFRNVKLQPLEKLSRNVTVRLLYTDPVIARKWRSKVKRTRVKVWTQDADIMMLWKDPKIWEPMKSEEKREKLFEWIRDNVDFSVRAQKID